MTGRRLARFPAFRAGVAQDDDVGSTLSQGSTTGVLSGPNWSYWPSRVLGSADPTTIAHRHGTHRITSPDETWLALQPFLAPAGITGVADVTWLDCLGIPTVQAVRPASLTLSVSQGKAASYRAAQVSAVMESLEGWHAENVTADLWSATARDLEADLTYDPAQLRHRPGSLYHAGVKLDWMVATTLLTGRRTWVPWTAVLVNVATRDCWEPPMFEMDTTGLASGNCYDEATLHALYEVMERHSVAAAVAGETMFEVPTDDVAGSDSAHLVEMIRDAGDDVDLARIDVWDGYYCFAAELTSATLEVTFGGFGLHHDPNVALSRAITEAAQSRITRNQRSPRGPPVGDLPPVRPGAYIREGAKDVVAAEPRAADTVAGARCRLAARVGGVGGDGGGQPIRHRAAGGRVRLRRCLCPRGEGARPGPRAVERIADAHTPTGG